MINILCILSNFFLSRNKAISDQIKNSLPTKLPKRQILLSYTSVDIGCLKKSSSKNFSKGWWIKMSVLKWNHQYLFLFVLIFHFHTIQLFHELVYTFHIFLKSPPKDKSLHFVFSPSERCRSRGSKIRSTHLNLSLFITELRFG